ncbi:MAG: NAD(P)H-hydrate dehydratase [Candidatus Nanohaloarchaea archaeon]
MEHLFRELDRSTESHKGENGRVAVIGGSEDYTGAPALASMAAYRTGCDLVKTMSASMNRDIISSFSESMIFRSYGELFDRDSVDGAVELSEWADATVIGPGLDPEPEAVREFVSRTGSELVVDADAIAPAVREGPDRAVFTPHRGEVDVIEEEYGSPGGLASSGPPVVVKGHTDRVHVGGEVFKNGTGCPEMTVGGTGDVLAGVIASLIAQDVDRVHAARLGAWINGKAGEMAAEELSTGMLPQDVIEHIPEVLRLSQ